MVLLSLGTLLGGVRVWVNASRSDDLRAYLRRLNSATAPLAAALDPASKGSIDEQVGSFTKGKLVSRVFRTLSDQWEKDFRAVKERVAALTPPAEVAPAHRTFLEGIDMYIGAVRLYNLAGQQRELAAQQKAAAGAIEEKVQVTLQHAGEWLSRAGRVTSLGGGQIQEFQREWLGIAPADPVTGFPRGLIQPSPQPSAAG